MFQNLIDTYSPILARVRQHIPNAVLAGGSLRDSFYGVEVKDLDFVIDHRGALDGRWPVTPGTLWLREIWPDKTWAWARGEDIEFYVQQGNGSGLQDVVVSSDNTVNFIIVDDIKKYTNHFPDSISEMVFDGEQVVVSERWRIGNENGEVYYNHIQPNRLEKLQRKYPDWAFINEQPQQDLFAVPLEW